MTRDARVKIAVYVSLCMCVTIARADPVYLSFYGYQSAPVGCFNEATDQSMTLEMAATVGPEFQGSSYYFGFVSSSNASYGCNLPDTNSPPGCAGYDVTAWFEPGALVIGHVNGSGDQNASLEGNEWDGQAPTEFTHIRIEYQSGFPCSEDARTLLVPIVWVSNPVPVSTSTWGRVKALYQPGGVR